MSFTKEEWDFISTQTKGVIAGLTGIYKELRGINDSLKELIELEKKKEEKGKEGN